MANKDAGRKPAEKSAKRKKKQAAQSNSAPTKQMRREQAAALLEEAMDIRNPIQRSVLLERVVDLDPGDIDAWVELADIEPDLEEAKGMLQTAIRHGCKQLQNELKADRGMFWTLPHTRPFMRAKFDLARVHRDQGNLEDATIILEELLDLNEMDNQAARWQLMDFYLRQDQIDDAEKLIARFPDDTLPFLAFTAVLVAFRKKGDSDNVRQQLKELAQRNPHIIPRLLDHQLIDYDVHPSFAPGSEEEADLYCQQMLTGWRSAPGAISWLRSASADLGLDTEDLREPLSDADIKKEIQYLRTIVKKLPQCAETWFAEGDAVAGDDGEDEGWVLTVIDEETEEAIFVEPGEGATVTLDRMLLGLLEAMLRPEFGEPRRPECITVFDDVILNKLSKRLERLGIESALATTRPTSADFVNSGLEAFIGGVAVDFEQLKSLPILPYSWVIDWKQLPISLQGPDGIPVNPWMILVMERESGCIIAEQLVMNEPDVEAFGAIIQQAAESDELPEAALPESFVVRSADNRPAVDAIAEKLDVPVLVGDCSVADEAFAGVSRHLGIEDGAVPSLVGVCDGDLSLVEDFYVAAADFFQSKIWLNVRSKKVVKVSCPDVLPGDWFAVVIGQMGQELGILFFNSLEPIVALHEAADFSDPSDAAEHIRGMSFSLNEEFAINPDEVAAVEQFGWPVAAPEAWPSANAVDGKSLQRVSADQLRFLSIAIKATIARILNDIADGSVSDKSAGETVTVNVALLDG